jgi:hypothetical protein
MWNSRLRYIEIAYLTPIKKYLYYEKKLSLKNKRNSFLTRIIEKIFKTSN